MTAKEALLQYQFGLARSSKDIPNLMEIATGKVNSRYPDYWDDFLGFYDSNQTPLAGTRALQLIMARLTEECPELVNSIVIE